MDTQTLLDSFEEIRTNFKDLFSRVSQLEVEPKILTGSGGGAPVDAEYLVNSANAVLTNEIVVTAATGRIIFSDASPQWTTLGIGTQYELLGVNVAGALPEWQTFDWDNHIITAGGDGVHTHANNPEGGQLDWDNVWSDAVHAHTNNAEGGTLDHFTALTNVTDDQHHTGFIGLEDTAATQVAPAADDHIQLNSTSGALTILSVPGNNRIDFTVNAAGLAHNLLSATHSDTVVNAVTRGSLVYGNSTPDWDELVHPGNAGYAFTTTATDVTWDLTPDWQGQHLFSAGLKLPDDQNITLGTGNSATVDYNSANSVVTVGGADWQFNVDDIHVLSATSDKPRITLESTIDTSVAPRLKFYHNSASPANNDDLGIVDFNGKTSAGAEERYAYLIGESRDVTDGDTGGAISAYITMDAIEYQFVRLSGYNGSVNEGEIIFNEDGQDVDFRVESASDTDALQVRGNDGQITLGALTAGIVNSDANGVLSVTATATPSAHNILSANHGDTLAAGVSQGSLICGNASPAWSELTHPGFTLRVLQTNATDVVWSANTLQITGNSVINGSLVGNITGGGTLATGGFTLTVPKTGTAVVGSGAVNRTAFWTDANTIGGDGGLTVDTANNMYTVADAGGYGNSTATARLMFDSSGVTDYGYFSGCNVGINTATPGTVLDATSSGNTDIRSYSSSASAFPMFVVSHPDQDWRIQLNGASDDFKIRDFTRSADRFLIDTSGNVGLNGVASPSSELDIGAGAMEFEEMTPPGAGAANTMRTYAVDDGGGQTALGLVNSSGDTLLLHDGLMETTEEFFDTIFDDSIGSSALAVHREQFGQKSFRLHAGASTVTTTNTLIADDAKDANVALRSDWMVVRTSDNDYNISSANTIPGGSATLYSNGGDVVTLNHNANGSVTVSDVGFAGDSYHIYIDCEWIHA